MANTVFVTVVASGQAVSALLPSVPSSSLPRVSQGSSRTFWVYVSTQPNPFEHGRGA